MYDRSVNVIYPAGAGGEFFSWLLAQNENFNPLSVRLEKNRWTLNPSVSGQFFHKDLKSRIYNSIADIDTKRIHIFRDHMSFNLRPENALIDKFLYHRYDKWKHSLFIFLYPQNQLSVEYANRQAEYKLSTNLTSSLEEYQFELNKKINAIGNRKYIVIDPYEFFISKQEDTLAIIQRSLQTAMHTPNIYFDRPTIEYFTDVWKRNNV